MKVSTEVVICGAGAAGLALAIELARRGVAIRVIEQREAPFQGSRGKGIQPRSLEIFEDMGVVNRLFAVGGAYPPTRTHHPDGSSADSRPNSARPAAFALKKFPANGFGSEDAAGTPSQLISRRPEPTEPGVLAFNVPRAAR